MYQKQKRAKVQKMTKKYSKLWNNRLIMQLYTLFCIKNKKFFLFFLKPWYNWYNSKKIVIPILICSFLYQRYLVQRGTIGTIVKKASNTNEIRGRARVFYFYFINYKIRGIQI